MNDRGALEEAHDGHPVGLVVRVRFEPSEAEAFAQTCARAGLSPTELLRLVYREYVARHPTVFKSA